MYSAYIRALDEADAQVGDGIYDRSVVVFTDGLHNAGNEAQLRQDALLRQQDSQADIYLVALGAQLDEDNLRPLARGDRYYATNNSDGLIDVFATVSDQIEAYGRSHYAVGICTPVALGEPNRHRRNFDRRSIRLRPIALFNGGIKWRFKPVR